MTDDAEFLHHEPCPSCGSKDNLGRYSDGHGYCFGCEHYEPAEGEPTTTSKGGRMSGDLLPIGEFKAIPSRGLTRETCAKWRYSVSKMGGKTVQIANYIDDSGRVFKQKVRTAGKDFPQLGDTKDKTLYGQWLWRSHGKMVVVTEGELDALSVSQAQGNKWPVVSLPSGAKSARKAIKANITWLEKFDNVILMFDMDEDGQDAVADCAPLFSPGKAKVAKLPLKDANEMLKANRANEIIDAIWGARPYRPDGVVSVSDIKEKALAPVEMGLPWFLSSLTNLTYGRRYGETYALGAGTGVGKTDFFMQQLVHDAEALDMTVGALLLEMPVTEAAKRAAGKMAKRTFHIPGTGWTQDELADALDRLGEKVFLYDHFGETDWEVIKERIRYMAVSLDIKVIYLDHLTAMADPLNERASLEQIMKEMAGLAQELGIIIHFISHLSTPDGRPHEEGGRVMIRHFKGARAIGFWSHFMFGMERDQQSEEVSERHTTTFRVLKDRYTGRSTGEVILLRYDAETGLLEEQPEECPINDDFDGDQPTTSEVSGEDF